MHIWTICMQGSGKPRVGMTMTEWVSNQSNQCSWSHIHRCKTNDLKMLKKLMNLQQNTIRKALIITECCNWFHEQIIYKGHYHSDHTDSIKREMEHANRKNPTKDGLHLRCIPLIQRVYYTNEHWFHERRCMAQVLHHRMAPNSQFITADWPRQAQKEATIQRPIPKTAEEHARTAFTCQANWMYIPVCTKKCNCTSLLTGCEF